MKKMIAALSLIALSGCASLDTSSILPSFWDDNQSHSIINVYQMAVNMDCARPQKPQAQAMVNELQWFQLYSESKGFLQKDVLKLIEPMQATVKEWADKDTTSPAYCTIKKKIVIEQAKTASKAVLGRF